MSRNHSTPFVLLSAELSTNTPALNAARNDMLKRQLAHRGFDFAEVVGSYKGSRETALLVLVPDGDFAQLAQLGRRYGQDSILFVDSQSYATLHYLNPPNEGGPDIRAQEALGTFQQVSPAQAQERDSWTHLNGNYYAVA